MTLPKSLPRICIALGCKEPDELLRQARSQAEAGETFFEFRLDYLRDPACGPAAIADFLREQPGAQVLATCRRRQNQGRFNGSVEEQIRVLEAASRAGAALLDLEIESAETCHSACTSLRAASWLMVSYHNFETAPPLDPLVRRLLRCSADAYKIAVTARKPSDIGRLLTLPKSFGRTPLVVLAMGEIGFPSRILAPLYGGWFTYAAPSGAEGTAPGQVSGHTLRHLYRFPKLSRQSKVYGVIADPVGHSISPAVHNRAFQARRIDAVYLPFRVPSPHLRDFMTLAAGVPIAGFSVTIPHKQRVLRYLDAVDPLARRIGAVNTVWRKAGRWRGTNTDAEAVTAPLARRLKIAKASILIAGNGGAARSAAFALAEAGARLAITGRNPDRVRALARACGAEALSRKDLASRSFDALVHATPLGMAPRVEECFFEDRIPAEVVFDMVYNPLETLLLRRAQEQGKTVIAGLEMFLEQAARQFEIWTGQSAPRAVMERAAREALGLA
ncbi:MAG: shikimate dehydrogenase [Bryobacteraceae bacterium]|nr:shikimate dehydrogenase [Bryobacteraceae bacterium]